MLDDVGVGDSVAVGGRGVGVIVGVAEEVGVVVAAGCVPVGGVGVRDGAGLQVFASKYSSISTP